CDGDTLLMLLDAAGVECSTGSACTAGVPEPSHVLEAMAVSPAVARGSLRFSLGRTSSAADVERVIDVLPAVLDRASRASSPRLRQAR
ncbi:MAG: aminotransferase class V-fold PLP-dependent enzyme, partial [Candidatus Nanopelagicales bacterium]